MDLKEDFVDEELDEYDERLAPKVELEEFDDEEEEEDNKVGPNKKEIDEDFEPDEQDDDDDDEVEEVDLKEELWEEMNGGRKNKIKKEVKDSGLPKGFNDSNLQLVKQLRAEIKSLRDMLNSCRKQKLAMKTAMKTPKEGKIKKWVREYIIQHHSRVWASFICDANPDRLGNFTEQEVLRAIGLRRISKKAYNYMRLNKLCPLPSDTTIRHWVGEHPEWEVETPGEYVRPDVSKKVGSGNIDSGNTVNPCGQCGKNFNQKALLHQHLAEVHGDERARKRFQCHVCDKWLSTERMMTGHQNMHMGIKTFKCTFCDRSYQNRGNMAQHRKQAHAEEWKAILQEKIKQGRKALKPCPSCEMEFSSKADLHQHLAEVHGDPSARETQCETCGKWFMSKVKLRDHMRTHTGDRPFSCDFCPQSFMSKGTLSAHLKERHPIEWEQNKDQIYARNREEGNRKLREAHLGRKRNGNKWVKSNGEIPILDEETGMVNENVFKCDFCDKAFINKVAMVAHCKEEHNEEREDQIWRRRTAAKASSNPCPICGVVLPIQSALNQHLAEIHDDPAAMELQCTMCKKWLGSKQLLDDHIRTHTGERPYKCDFCPKSFKTSKALGVHRQRMHQKEWEANKEEIMARNRALVIGKRYKNNKLNVCGEDNGEAAILDAATGMVYNAPTEQKPTGNE